MDKKYTIKKMPSKKSSYFDCKKHQDYYYALKTIVDYGEYPTIVQVSNLAKCEESYLKSSTKLWKKNILALIKKKQEEWKLHGGNIYIKISKTIDKYIDQGKRPTKYSICLESGVGPNYLYWESHSFQSVLLNRIKKECHLYDLMKQKKKEKKRIQKITEKQASIPTDMKPLITVSYTLENLHLLIIDNDTDINTYKSISLTIYKTKYTVPLSQIMYEKRKRPTKLRKYYILENTFNPSRIILLHTLIHILFPLRNSLNTMNNTLLQILNYLDFCDDHSNIYIPLNVKQARLGYQSYVNDLVQRISLSQLSNTTANTLQNSAIKFITKIFPDPNVNTKIFKKIHKIPKYESSNKTQVNNRQAIEAVTYYYHFFTKITKIVLDEQTIFPCVITIQNTKYLCIPYGQRTIYQENANTTSDYIFSYFNINTPSLHTFKEISSQLKKNDKYERERENAARKKQYKKFLSKINIMNDNMYNPYRIQLAQYAFQAFYMLFAVLTGMKDSELYNFSWGTNDEFDIQKTFKKGVVTIKPRSSYREMTYEIQRFGITLLRQATKLRRYLLKNNNYDKFFFTGHSDHISNNAIQTGSYAQAILQSHQTINPKLPSIGTRQFRVFKNQTIITQNNGNAWLASVMLGHSLKTNATHYQDKVKHQQEEELYNFAKAMISTTKRSTNQDNTFTCDSYEQPEYSIDNSTLTCDNIFACFICKKYKLYPDKEDIHKLLSLRYVIYRINQKRTFNEEHFNQVLKPVDQMAETLLHIMLREYNCKTIMKNLQTKVYNHAQLHPYWDFKLRYLYDLGIL